jgi:hypothetical protein
LEIQIKNHFKGKEERGGEGREGRDGMGWDGEGMISLKINCFLLIFKPQRVRRYEAFSKPTTIPITLTTPILKCHFMNFL